MILRPKGPPLNSLRAFEASARLESFTAAADELNVTPGAIAQQIKSLEAWLGVALFERHAQGVSLTEIGRASLPKFVQAFDGMAEAVQSLQRAADPNHIRIAALPAVAQLWLSGVLPSIRKAFSALNISVATLEVAPNLDREPYDLWLFYEYRVMATESEIISDDVISPVCAPSVAKSLREPKDLLDHVLLVDEKWPDDWAAWLGEHLPEEYPDFRRSQFSLFSLALEEAINGAGVLMGHQTLVAKALAKGQVIQPFVQQSVLPRCLTLKVSSIGETNPAVVKVAQLLRKMRSTAQ